MASSTDSDDEDVERKRGGSAKVVEAKWTEEGSVRITYDGSGVHHACMNPAHGCSKRSYHVLHLVPCASKHNAAAMTAAPLTKQWQPYQHCHKLCEPCFADYGPARCFKCDDPCADEVAAAAPLLDTLLGEEAVASAADFVECVRRWQSRRARAHAAFLVLHCTVLGGEAQMLRQKFGLKRGTAVHVVYSDAVERLAAGSGVDLDASPFRDSWRGVMKERVEATRDPTAVFFGNALLNGLDLDELTLADVLVMYAPTIFAEFYAHSLAALMNSLHTFTPLLNDGLRRPPGGRPGKVRAPAPPCCLDNAVTHAQRAPASVRDQALYDSANLVASQVYKGVAAHFGPQVCREFEQRAAAALGAELRIGLEGEAVPFHNLYVARGGAVRLQRASASHESPAGLEIVCWTAYGAPEGGDFVIPGLMYKFATGQSSTVVFRPSRFFHATLPPEKRDMTNEKFAVALMS